MPRRTLLLFSSQVASQSEAKTTSALTGMQVTIAAGLATLRAGEHSDSFLARADKALYQSKAQGRNRITSA